MTEEKTMESDSVMDSLEHAINVYNDDLSTWEDMIDGDEYQAEIHAQLNEDLEKSGDREIVAGQYGETTIIYTKAIGSVMVYFAFGSPRIEL